MVIRSSQQDYILRLIQQMAAVVATLLGLRGGGKLDEALDVVSDAEGELLGPMAGAAAAVDAATAAQMIGEPLKVAAWARLLAARAELLRDGGDEEGAAAVEARSEALAAEALSRAGPARSVVERILADGA